MQLEANQPIDNYWIRANPNEGTQGFAGGINSAILRYEGAPPTEPNSTVVQPNVKLLRETDLTPFVRMPVVSAIAYETIVDTDDVSTAGTTWQG